VIPYEDFLRARALMESTCAPLATPAGASERDVPAAGADGSDQSSESFIPRASAEPSTRAEAHSSDPADERLEEIRCKIGEGYYDRPEILEEMVQRILSSLSPQQEGMGWKESRR
jgi:hypothetical protein